MAALALTALFMLLSIAPVVDAWHSTDHLEETLDWACTYNGEDSVYRCPWWDGQPNYAGAAPCEDAGIADACARHAPAGLLTNAVRLTEDVQRSIPTITSLALSTVLGPKYDVWAADSPSGRDAGDIARDAVPVQPGTHSGSLFAHVDGADWYSFDATEGQGFRIEIEGEPWVSSRLYDPTGAARSDLYQTTHETRARPSGTWLLRIDDAGHPAPAIEYTWTLETFDLNDDDAASGTDAPDIGPGLIRPHPLVVEPGAHEGALVRTDRSDHYAVHAERRDVVRVTLHADPLLEMSLLTGDGLVGSTLVKEVVADGPQEFTIVSRERLEGSYTLEVEVLPYVPPPGVWDIEIASITEHVTSPDTQHPYGAHVFELVIRNDGDIAIDGFRVDWRTDPPSPYFSRWTDSSPTRIAPGEATIHVIGFTYPLDVGQKRITFHASIDDEDADPSNNEVTATTCFHTCALETPP